MRTNKIPLEADSLSPMGLLAYQKLIAQQDSVYQRYERAKRTLDVVIALLVLVSLAPLWLAIALSIKLTSKGPVLYTARVVGRYGKEFTYYKFRSMVVNSDSSTHRSFIKGYVRGNTPFAMRLDPKSGQAQPVFKVVDDPRITAVGRLIRKTSLDEIPQLINVLWGEMSLVGPRPPLVYEYSLYNNWAKQRLAVTPGITGWAQVAGRGSASFDEMVQLDIEYIRQRSLRLDLTIILRTIPAVISSKGAN